MFKTTKEAMVMLRRKTPKAAIALLEQLRVRPIVLGREYLWPTAEIVMALEKRRRGGPRPAKLPKVVAWNTADVLRAVHGDPQATQ
jgi:hypothetical protein